MLLRQQITNNTFFGSVNMLVNMTSYFLYVYIFWNQRSSKQEFSALLHGSFCLLFMFISVLVLAVYLLNYLSRTEPELYLIYLERLRNTGTHHTHT